MGSTKLDSSTPWFYTNTSTNNPQCNHLCHIASCSMDHRAIRRCFFGRHNRICNSCVSGRATSRVGIAVLASIICAYVAAVVNGLIILNLQLIFTLTVWAGWNILGAIIGFALALPIIAALEKAEVRKVKAE